MSQTRSQSASQISSQSADPGVSQIIDEIGDRLPSQTLALLRAIDPADVVREPGKPRCHSEWQEWHSVLNERHRLRCKMSETVREERQAHLAEVEAELAAKGIVVTGYRDFPMLRSGPVHDRESGRKPYRPAHEAPAQAMDNLEQLLQRSIEQASK